MFKSPSRRYVYGAALVLAALGILLYAAWRPDWSVRDAPIDEEGESEATHEAMGAGLKGRTTVPAVGAESTAGTVDEPGPAEEDGRLRFSWARVSSARGPLAGATLSLLDSHDSPAGEYTADAAGLVRAEFVPGPGARALVRADGFRGVFVVMPAPDDLPVAVVLEHLTKPLLIRVVDQGSSPVSGLEVWGLATDGRRLPADELADGQYSVDAARGELRSLISYDPSGTYADGRWSTPFPGEDAETFVTVDGAMLSQVILLCADDDQVVLGGWMEHSLIRNVRVDAGPNGVISSRHWAAAGKGSGIVAAPGYMRSWVSTKQRDAGGVIRARLRRGPWIRGRVTLDGRPLPRAYVVGTQRMWHGPAVTTSSAGEFEIPSFCEGDTGIVLSHPAIGSRTLEFPKGIPVGDRYDWKIELRGTQVMVRVVDERGDAAAGAWIAHDHGVVNRTGSDGTAMLSVAGDDALWVRASTTDALGVAFLQPLNHEGDDALQVVLRPRMSLEGVFSKVNGSSVAVVRLDVPEMIGPVLGVARPDANGRFSLPDIPARTPLHIVEWRNGNAVHYRGLFSGQEVVLSK